MDLENSQKTRNSPNLDDSLFKRTNVFVNDDDKELFNEKNCLIYGENYQKTEDQTHDTIFLDNCIDVDTFGKTAITYNKYQNFDAPSSSNGSSPRKANNFCLTSSSTRNQKNKCDRLSREYIQNDHEQSHCRVSGAKKFFKPVSSNWSSFDSVEKYPRSGRRLEHSRAKLDLSQLNTEPKPSFTCNSSDLLSSLEPKKNFSFTSVADRYGRSISINEKPSFTSLPESVEGTRYVPFINDVPRGTKRNKILANWEDDGLWKNSLSCLREGEDEEVYSMLSRGSDDYYMESERLDNFADMETDRMNSYKFSKYEIPSFYAFNPRTGQSECSSSPPSEINESGSCAGDDKGSKFATVTVDTEMDDRPSTRPVVSKFTLPKARRDEFQTLRIPSKPPVRKQTMMELGQGDSPWNHVPDGSEESEGEETPFTVGVGVRSQAWNQYDTIETITSDASALEIQNNIKNTALNNKKIVQSEGKISRFFSRLRKSPSASSADLKQPTLNQDSNGRDPYSAIIPHDDNQSTKKSKMCIIL